MNQKPSKIIGALTCKTSIFALSLVALACTCLSFSEYFMYYEDYPELAFRFPSFFEIVFFILNIAPSLLLIFYVKKIFKTPKRVVTIPTIYATIAITPAFSFIVDTIAYDRPIRFILRYFQKELLFGLAIVVSYTLITIFALNGRLKKRWVLLSATVGLIMGLSLIIDVLLSLIQLHEGDIAYLYVFADLSAGIGTVILHLALLLFGLKAKIPAIIHLVNPIKVKSSSPEQELKLLQEKLDLGIITEEEYQAQRAEIINKL